MSIPCGTYRTIGKVVETLLPSEFREPKNLASITSRPECGSFFTANQILPATRVGRKSGQVLDFATVLVTSGYACSRGEVRLRALFFWTAASEFIYGIPLCRRVAHLGIACEQDMPPPVLVVGRRVVGS
jgi:hypothetical protein